MGCMGNQIYSQINQNQCINCKMTWIYVSHLYAGITCVSNKLLNIVFQKRFGEPRL